MLANFAFMYTVSNPTVGFTAQFLVSVFLILYAIFFNKIPKKARIFIYVVSMFPITFAMFLFTYGNLGNTNYEEDVVIVLGAGIIGETVTRPLAHRLNKTVDYLRKNPNATVITTGGLGNRAHITEAEAMARYLRAREITAPILLEEKSTSTHENLLFSKEILDESFPHGFNAVVVTNDFHIFRSVRMARNVGIFPNRLGAKTDWYSVPVNYFREMLAVAFYFVFG
ncbi:MAG: YdcF family protein [Defluviitaleaceae bacterium]|nr:YdcF family protein [Defluviitaleaceae bacterium]